MGDVCFYTLKRKGPATLEEIVESIEKLLEDGLDFIPMDPDVVEEDDAHSNDQYGLCSDDWYCWRAEEECMAALSRAFPETLFTLEAEGEVSEITHRTYAKNGKLQTVYPVITWLEPEFGEP